MKRTLVMMMVVAMVGPLAALAAPPVLGEGKGSVTLTWDEFVKITGYDPAKKGAQVITVPWKEIEQMLDVKIAGPQVKGATVDLPWKDFEALLRWSIERKKPKETPPPTDYIVTSSTYTGMLGEKSAEITLAMKIAILRKDGWKRIPVLPGTVALKDSTVPEGLHVNTTGGAYEILTEKSGTFDVSFTFAVAVTRSGGVNSLSMSRVAGGPSVVQLTVGGKDVDVKVTGAQSITAKGQDDKTVVAAALAPSKTLSVTWERAIPKAPAAPTKLYAETRTLVAVADGLLLCQENVNYNILHSPVRELKLTVPAGASVLTVTGSNVQDWRVSKTGELAVVLSRETVGYFNLRIAYEQVIKDAPAVPVIRTVGAERERGFVGVVALANVELASGKIAGAREVDVRQLPADIAAMTSQPVLLAYRYVGADFTLPLAIKKHGEVAVLVTIADNALYTIMQLNDGRRMTKVVLSVRNNRNQFLRIKMPAGAEIWSAAVSGRNVTPAKDEKGNVLVPLVRSSSTSRELTSFPVELVYVETPAATAPAEGKLTVNLPTLGVPAMHIMCNYYLPAEGTYTVRSGGLFGGSSRSGFGGVLAEVEEFAAVAPAPGVKPIQPNPAQQVKQMDQQFNRQAVAEARAAGAAPIRVKLPVNGKLFKLEKILALPSDTLYFSVQYKGWKVSK